MNKKQEELLAIAIDRELKQLPELSAPETLAGRVMGKLKAEEMTRLPAAVVSFRRRQFFFASFALIAFVAGLLAWRFLQPSLMASAWGRLEQSFPGVAMIWSTLAVLVDAVGFALQKIGWVFIALGLMLIATAYFALIGFGTVMVRAAVVRR